MSDSGLIVYGKVCMSNLQAARRDGSLLELARGLEASSLRDGLFAKVARGVVAFDRTAEGATGADLIAEGIAGGKADVKWLVSLGAAVECGVFDYPRGEELMVGVVGARQNTGKAFAASTRKTGAQYTPEKDYVIRCAAGQDSFDFDTFEDMVTGSPNVSKARQSDAERLLSAIVSATKAAHDGDFDTFDAESLLAAADVLRETLRERMGEAGEALVA